MIMDRLDQIARYAAVHPRFDKAVEFLQGTDLAGLSDGRHDIDGDDMFAMACRDPAKTRDQAKLEAHRKYIDIQVVLDGTDEIGWKSRPTCETVDVEYDAEKDVEFLADPPDAWVAVCPGAFAVFFPEDAHAPLVGAGELKKVVVKIAVD